MRKLMPTHSLPARLWLGIAGTLGLACMELFGSWEGALGVWNFKVVVVAGYLSIAAGMFLGYRLIRQLIPIFALVDIGKELLWLLRIETLFGTERTYVLTHVLPVTALWILIVLGSFGPGMSEHFSRSSQD